MEFGTSNGYGKLQRSRERRNSFEWLSALERAENSVSSASMPEMGLQQPRAGSELVPQEWPGTARPLKAQLREAAPQLA